MKIKTNELTGAALDWAVAKCEGHNVFIKHAPVQVMYTPERKRSWYIYTPSTNWSQGGPIIDREDIAISPAPDGLCSAYKSDGTTRWLTKGGPTPTSGVEVFNWTFKQQGYHPLIAAMRCYVASKLGDEVEIPEELT
jgi:hypothetical protein